MILRIETQRLEVSNIPERLVDKEECGRGKHNKPNADARMGRQVHKAGETEALNERPKKERREREMGGLHGANNEVHRDSEMKPMEAKTRRRAEGKRWWE